MRYLCIGLKDITNGDKADALDKDSLESSDCETLLIPHTDFFFFFVNKHPICFFESTTQKRSNQGNIF